MILILNALVKPSGLTSVCFRPPLNFISTSPICQKSHYDCLGVPQNATQSDIKAAYYKLSLLYHPDRNDTPEAANSFREITEAYEIIGNFKLRKMYDKGLLGHMGSIDEGTKRTYSDFNPSSSRFKNRPTHHDRSSVYNFDAWSQFHYGDSLNQRNKAKMKYEEKIKNTTSRGQGMNENVVISLFGLTLVMFMATYSMNTSSFDDPPTIKGSD